jgi:NAD(P)-dependent dehydrogenase (short-subunit alcohol dehydrogenase family)
MSDLRRFDLTGRNALVTGGSRGLGKAMALGLARAGADVVVASRTSETLDIASAEIRALGRRSVGFPVDVRSVENIEALFRQTAAFFDGALDILVCAAGTNVRTPTLETTEDNWNAVVDTNLKGTFFCCKEAGRLMIPRRFGRIIVVGSMTTSIGIPTVAPYSATKSGVFGIVKCLAIEWGPHNITVNGIAPGWFETDLTRVLFRRPGWLDALLDRTPLGRSGVGDDLAEVATFLASDAASYITGQMLNVDGGFLAGWKAGLVTDTSRERTS